MPQPHIFIATHHKCATVWMNTTFRRIGKARGYPFVHLNTGEWAWDTRPDKHEYMLNEMHRIESEGDAPGIFVDYHSTTPDLSALERARGIHLVRDPRDMLISAIRYHETSEESWLDEQLNRFGGMTFRQKLLSYDNYTDRLRFELDTFMGEEIERMATFQDRPDHGTVFVTARYEDLIADNDMTRFHTLCVHLGLTGEDLIAALGAYWQSSVFGGMRDAQQSGSHAHIRHGGAEQWREALDEDALGCIHDRIGPQIEKLGYPLV